MTQSQFETFAKSYGQKIIRQYREDDITISVCLDPGVNVLTPKGLDLGFEKRINAYSNDTVIMKNTVAAEVKTIALHYSEATLRVAYYFISPGYQSIACYTGKTNELLQYESISHNPQEIFEDSREGVLGMVVYPIQQKTFIVFCRDSGHFNRRNFTDKVFKPRNTPERHYLRFVAVPDDCMVPSFLKDKRCILLE